MWRLGVRIVVIQLHWRRGHGRLRRRGGVMHRGHVRLPCTVSAAGESRARRGQRRRGGHVHRRRHPHLLLHAAADSGGCGLLLLGLLRRRDARRGGGAELLLLGARHRRGGRSGACWWHVHPRSHLRRRRRLIHSTPADHVWRQSAAPHRPVVRNCARREPATRHHVRRGRHRAWSAHRHPTSVRTHHSLLLLHPHHGHPLLLRVLHLHVVLLLLHADGHSLLLLHNVRRHRTP